jgi:proline iminopeptidase
MRICWLLGAVFMRLLLAPMLAGQSDVHEATFTNAGLTLHYTVQGQGSPVVLLSGGPGHNAAYMQPVAEMLATGHTVILLEQRGTGHSVPAAIDATTVNEALYISDLEALRHALGLQKWTLLGHSFGSYTAMRYAIEHPAETQSLVLLATTPPLFADDHLSDNVASRMGPEIKRRLAELAEREKTASPEDAKALQLEQGRLGVSAYFFDVSKADPLLALPEDRAMMHKISGLLFTEHKGFDFTADLKKLHVPTLIVQGRQDPLDLEMAARARDAIPGAKLVILERCGHFAWLEQPEQLRNAMLDFLR